MSLHRRVACWGAAAVVGLAVAGCTDQSPAVAYVNGQPISQSDYMTQLETVRTGMGAPAGVSTLDSLVQGRLLVDEAHKEGVAPTQEELSASYNSLIQDPGTLESLHKSGMTPEQFEHTFLEPQICLYRIIGKLAGVTDADISAFYTQHRAELRRPERVSARILQVSDRKVADEARKEVGKVKFETIVQNFGARSDPASNAGSIVTLTKNALGSSYPPAVVDAAFSTPKGKTTGVIEATPGASPFQPRPTAAPPKQYYIVEVEDHLPAQEPDPRDPLVRSQILQAVARQKAGSKLSPTAVQDLLSGLRRRAQIEVVRPSLKSVEQGPPAAAPGMAPR